MRHLALAIAVPLLATLTLAAEQPSKSNPERYTAFAVSTGGIRSAPVAQTVEFTISRFSTQAESQRLLAVLKEKGADGLLDTLRDLPSVGTIRTPGNLAYDLRYAQQEDLGDGIRRVVLATDRPMSFWETVNRPRTVDYPFTFIELRLNKDGTGEGKLSLATRVTLSRRGTAVELENYDSQPIALNEVRRDAR